MTDHDDQAGFEGDATVAVDSAAPRAIRATLAARFDPLAGHLVWSGRVGDDLPPRTPFHITTPHGTARAEAVERDVWGNTRLTGVDRPPFPVELFDGPDVRP